MRIATHIRLAAALCLLSAAPAFGDSITLETRSYEELKALSISGGSVEFISNDGKNHEAPLDKVVSIEIKGQIEFNEAELNRHNPFKAVEIYREAIGKTKDYIAKQLAKFRIVSMLDATGEYGEAMQIFAPLYAEDPCDEIWRLRPVRIPRDNEKHDLDMAAEALKHALETILEGGGVNAEELLVELLRRAGKEEESKAAAEVLAKHKAEEAEVAKSEAELAESKSREKFSVTLCGIQSKGALRVAYVIDHSGSLIDTMDLLRDHINKSVETLSKEQRFSVIAFSERPDNFFPQRNRYINATDSAKASLAKDLKEIRAGGKNDDLLVPFANSMRMALAMKPDVIYLVTDGNFAPALVDDVKKHNTNKTVVNTVAFIKISPEAKQSLETIAADNSGQFKFVTEKDLGK